MRELLTEFILILKDKTWMTFVKSLHRTRNKKRMKNDSATVVKFLQKILFSAKRNITKGEYLDCTIIQTLKIRAESCSDRYATKEIRIIEEVENRVFGWGCSGVSRKLFRFNYLELDLINSIRSLVHA